MENKLLINKMKNAAELAWAAYGYYDLMTSDTNQLFVVLKDEKGEDKTDSGGNPVTQEITLINIMDSNYVEHNVVGKDKWDKDFETVGTLKGDMSPAQAKRFFDKYDLLDFYPKLDIKNNKQIQGFHACLFGEKKLQSHSETKEKSYTNYTLAIRGSFDSKDYVEADFWHLLINSTIPFDYYNDMLNFYEQCVEKYPNLKQSKSLNIVGHSLGGALAQMLTLSLCNDTNEANINEVYTFNSPGAKDLKPNIDLKLDGELYYVDSDIINSPNPAQMLFDKIMGDKTDINIILRAIYEVGNVYYRTEKELLSALQIYFSNIPQNNRQPHQIFLYRYTSYQYRYNARKYKVYKASSMFVKSYNTLKHNYENRKTYKLSVSDRVFHIATDDDANPDNNQWQDELIQNLGIDIDGKHYYVNIGIGLRGTQYITKIGKGWFESHSLVPLTQTLYFYSYLLELESNDTTIQRSITQRKIKKPTLQPTTNNATNNTNALDSTTSNTSTQNTHIDSTISHKDTKHNANADSTTDTNTNVATQTHDILADYLHELNVFMDNIRIAMNILVYEIDKENKKKYERFKKEKAWYEKTQKYNDIDFLALLISQINKIAYKLEALKEDSNTYFTPSIDKEHIIEALLEFIESKDSEYISQLRVS